MLGIGAGSWMLWPDEQVQGSIRNLTSLRVATLFSLQSRLCRRWEEADRDSQYCRLHVRKSDQVPSSETRGLGTSHGKRSAISITMGTSPLVGTL